jgi:general secretion pathway protein M
MMAPTEVSPFSQRFSGAMQPVRNYWDARAPRERRILGALGALVLLALLYLLLIEPALSGREQLRKSLPALRGQVSQVQGMARELSATKPSAGAEVQPATRENIEASLTRAGLKAQSVNVSGELTRVQLNNVSFAALSAWLDQVAKALGISVTEAAIVAQAQADIVNATLTLRQQRQ